MSNFWKIIVYVLLKIHFCLFILALRSKNTPDVTLCTPLWDPEQINEHTLLYRFVVVCCKQPQPRGVIVSRGYLSEILPGYLPDSAKTAHELYFHSQGGAKVTSHQQWDGYDR